MKKARSVHDLKMFFGSEGQGGQAIVLIAVMMLALIFVVGLAVDAGQLYAAKRTQQEAADAGAFAGAVVFYQGGTSAQAVAAAVTDVAKNGYTDGVNNTTVTVNSPPASGLYAGNAQHVEVIILRQVMTTLAPAEGSLNQVRARGVAGAQSLNNGYAIMALATSCATFGLSVSVNENVHLTGGGVLVNSCGNPAVSGFTSGQDFLLPAPYTVDIVGTTAGNSFPAGVSVNSGVIAARPDPFSGFPKPTGLSYNGVSTLPTNPPRISGSTAVEGIYTTTLGGPPGAAVKLCHGIYILKGGGFGGDISQDLTNTDPNTGTPCDGKVLIFNTTSNWPLNTGTCSNMGSAGNHPITLAPMTTGTYANMGIYQDPACTTSLIISGNDQLSLGGTIYIPNGDISLNGNPATILAGQLIAQHLFIQNGNLNIDYSAGTTAQPILPRLAE